jgi:hypothetical protein
LSLPAVKSFSGNPQEKIPAGVILDGRSPLDARLLSVEQGFGGNLDLVQVAGVVVQDLDAPNPLAAVVGRGLDFNAKVKPLRTV